MEEKRREDQSGEVDSSTHEENSEGAAPVRKLKQFSWPLGVFRQLMLIFFFSLSPGSRSQKWGGGVLLLSVAKGPLCCAAPGLEPPQPPARQRAVQTELVEPAAAAGWAEGPEGAVWPDEESAQVGRPNLWQFVTLPSSAFSIYEVFFLLLPISKEIKLLMNELDEEKRIRLTLQVRRNKAREVPVVCCWGVIVLPNLSYSN